MILVDTIFQSMNNRPVYENLDTSFVNLSGLVRYLRRRQFVGRVRIELSSYEADIVLEDGNTIQVREHDKIAGRIAEGEEALQRLLIRAREPGGIIHVYQITGNGSAPKIEKPTTPLPGEPKPVQKEAVKEVVKETVVEITKVSRPQPVPNGSAVKPVKAAAAPKPAPSLVNRPNFPFELKNSVEEKARSSKTKVSVEDWQTLMNLTAELLGTIDRSLSVAKLDFKAAFSKSCSEIATDYPFLNPSTGNFTYLGAGKIRMKEQVNAKLFAAGITEALRRILEKLGANPKFAEVYRATVQKILALINQRKPLYEKFFFTPQLQKILGT